MKRIISVVLISLCLVFLVGCGEKEVNYSNDLEWCKDTGTGFVDDSSGTECLLYLILLELRKLNEKGS